MSKQIIQKNNPFIMHIRDLLNDFLSRIDKDYADHYKGCISSRYDIKLLYDNFKEALKATSSLVSDKPNTDTICFGIEEIANDLNSKMDIHDKFWGFLHATYFCKRIYQLVETYKAGKYSRDNSQIATKDEIEEERRKSMELQQVVVECQEKERLISSRIDETDRKLDEALKSNSKLQDEIDQLAQKIFQVSEGDQDLFVNRPVNEAVIEI